MTTKEIAEAVGKTERAIQKWLARVADKSPSIKSKRFASTPTRPANYDLQETISIIKEGMGSAAAAVYESAVHAGYDFAKEDAVYSVEKSGHVYLCRDCVSGYTKIGMTTTGLTCRLQSLKVANPRLEIVGAIDSSEPRNLERRIHKDLADKWVSGEWFDLSRADIDGIVKQYGVKLAIAEGVENDS
jgi:hypothetical protein